MMYIACLIITCLIANIANEWVISPVKSKRKQGMGLIVLVILIFSIIAGLRDYSVGTDISYYGFPSFRKAQILSAADYYSIDGAILEPLYVGLNYAIVTVFNSFGILLFTLQFLTSLFVLLRLCDYKYTNKIWLGVLIYNCTFFPISLNLMRQSIAIAMVFYATRYLFGSELKENIKRYILIVVLSMGFHVSGAIGIAVLAFYIMYRNQIKYGKDKMAMLKTLALICVMVAVVLLFDKFVDIIVPLTSFTSKFSRYDDQSFTGVQLNPILVRLPFVLIALLFWKNYKKRSSENYLLFVFVVVDMILAELRSYSTSLYRVSIYFAYFKMLEVPCLIDAVGVKNKKILSAIITILCITIWAYQIVYQGNESVFPYVFRS